MKILFKRIIALLLLLFFVVYAFCDERPKYDDRGFELNYDDDPEGSEEEGQEIPEDWPEAEEKLEEYGVLTNDLGNDVNSVKGGQKTEAGEGATNSEKAEKNELGVKLAAASAEAENAVQGNKEKVTSEKNTKKSEKAGDPVKITKGTFELLETDITTGPASDSVLLSVIRRYESECPIAGSFGYGWKTNLDERIIRGLGRGYQKEIDAYNTYLQKTEKLISDYERTILEAYNVSSLANAKNEIAARKDLCDSLSLKATTLRQKMVTFRASMDKFPKYASAAGDLIDYLDRISIKNAQTKNTLEVIDDSIDDEIKIVDKLRKAYAEQKEKRDYLVETQRQWSIAHERNKKVLFSGMSNCYEETGYNSIVLFDEDGYPHIFELKDSLDMWYEKDNKKYLLCEAFGKGFKLYQTDGFIKYFDENGFIEKITDRNQNAVFINRNSQGRIDSIENSFGEKWRVEYSGQFISKLTNVCSAEEHLFYTYSGNKLISVRDTDGDLVSMDYDAAGHLIKLNKCDGSFVSYVYGEQTSDGSVLVTATINEENHAENFEYNLHKRFTDHIDCDGNRTRYFYDEYNRTIQKNLPDGSLIKNTYDQNDNLILSEENGFVTRYFYDEKGNKIRSEYPDGAGEIWTYDNYNLMTSYIDRDGIREDYIRDERGNLLEWKRAGVSLLSQQVDSKGLVSRKVTYGPKDITTEYIYDSHGNLICEKSNAHIMEYEYDERNRIKTEKRNGKIIKEYVYNNHSVSQKYKNGLLITYQTNGRKDITKIIQKDLITGVSHVMRIEYDKRHLPVHVYEGDGKTEDLLYSFLYTPDGKIKNQILHGDSCWIKFYDYKNSSVSKIKEIVVSENLEKNQITEEMLNRFLADSKEVNIQKIDYKILNGNAKIISLADSSGILNLFEYDAFGNLIKTTDGNDNIRLKKYTRSGLCYSEQSIYGGWYEYGYDPNGNLNKFSEQGGIAVQSDYYPDGSLKSQKDRYGKITNYLYDEIGRLSSIQNAAQKIWYSYDDNDRIVKMVYGNYPAEDSADYFVSFEYSEDERNLVVTEGNKYKTKYVLDAFGNPIRTIDANNNERSFVYDYQNRMTESSDGYGNKTFYEYNALGELCRLTMPDGTQQRLEYNCFHRLSKITDNCGLVYTADYNKSGNLIKDWGRADSEKTYEYDNTGRITKILCGGEIIESYSYGQNYRLVTVKDGNGNDYLYNLDAFGRLVEEHNRNGLNKKYFYDEEGELKSDRDFDGTSTIISYSDDRREKKIIYPDGSENKIIYDSVGNIIEAKNDFGQTQYKYDKGGKLIYQKDVNTDEELFFEYDAAGNRTRLYSSNRDTKYTYGRNNEIIEVFDNKQRVGIKLKYNKNGSEALRNFGNGTVEETLYDKAGRIIVKTQKSEKNEILWGEGYVYGEDGKRSATIDNQGRVTLYKYNKKGQLSELYYPYSEELINVLKDEAEINGLSVTADIGETRYFSSAEKASFIHILNTMQYGLAFNFSNLQNFIKEEYCYDKNGNRISKKNDFGTINYSYDKENLLLSSGSHGQTFVIYTYDKCGNLLAEEGPQKSIEYTYNPQNRLASCQIKDNKNKSYVQTTYTYDAVGRRVTVQDTDSPALRTIYDGFTFDVIRQNQTYENGMFTDVNENGIRWGNTGRPTGERYRYISDEEPQDGNRYFYLDEENYKTASSRFKGERTQITVNGSLAAQVSSDSGIVYYTNDILGSVTNLTDSYGSVKLSFTYDAFGKLIQGTFSASADSGYLSKQYDPTTSLYNYGYRDYSPTTARFTTVDPIRDGNNWFTYCNNDPVNFVDPDGLFYYSANGQKSINDYKQTTVYIIRKDDGLGNEFNAFRVIKKTDAYGNTDYKLDIVGANCREKYYEEDFNTTTPDGIYYLTSNNLKRQDDETYNSNKYENVLALATNDQSLTQQQRNTVNIGDRYFHANQQQGKDIYTDNKTPESAGCIIGQGGQKHQNEIMEFLMKGVERPESIIVKIKSISNIGGCNK